jgi:hypothetical protein
MIFYASLLIFTIGGKEKLIDLRWPVKISDNSIIGKIRITKSYRMGKNILTRSKITYILPLFSLESFPQDGLNHISVAMIEHFFQKLWWFIEEIIESAGFNNWVELIVW